MEGRPAGPIIRHHDDAPWEPADRFGVPPGALCHVYHESGEGGLTTMIGQVPAGWSEPRHVHEATEHWAVILEGEMHVEGQVLRAGDYFHAPAGVPHGPFAFPVGCKMFTSVRGAAWSHEFDGGETPCAP